MEYNSLSIGGFLVDIELSLMKNKFNYYANHDSYFIEADANYRGVVNAKKYMMDYYPLEYDKEKYDIDLLEWRYLLDFKMYDVTKTFDLFVKFLKKNNKHSYNLNAISPALPIFLNSNCSFKTLDEIFQNSLLYSIDREIVYGIIASKSFWENFNCDEISDEYISVILECLNRYYTIYNNKIKYLKELDIQRKAEYRQRMLSTNNQIIQITEYMLYISEKIGRLIEDKKIIIKSSLDFIKSKIDTLENKGKNINYK